MARLAIEVYNCVDGRLIFLGYVGKPGKPGIVDSMKDARPFDPHEASSMLAYYDRECPSAILQAVPYQEPVYAGA